MSNDDMLKVPHKAIHGDGIGAPGLGRLDSVNCA